MRSLLLCSLYLYLTLHPASLTAQAMPSELQALRDEMAQLRADYEARIAQLEQRLEAAEQSAAAQVATTATGSPRSSTGRFNPDLGVIFQGQAWSYSSDPGEYRVPGFPLGGEAGPAPEGLSSGEIEINVSANVDDKFTAWLTLPVSVEDGEAEVEVEEAWIETTALPAGLSLRMGRFYSNIGYLNDKHSHSWDFADQPLAYQAFLGNQHLDDGLQARWLAPTSVYLELGAQVTRGDRYPAAGAARAGVGSYALHARTGGDIGFDHSWQAGLSYLSADAADRDSGPEDEPLRFSGETRLWMAEFVWKWAPDGNNKQSNFVVQGEYLWRDEDGVYALPGGPAQRYQADQRGWYLQAVYQPFPHWRAGIRHDRMNADSPGDNWLGTSLMPGARAARRYTVMADWSNSEFSRLRLQYALDQVGPKDDKQWGLQYIFSIGAHGAHSF